MTPRVVGVIPARWGSTRLPGKMLADICGKPLIVRTLESADRAESLDELLVATDDRRIADAVSGTGATVVITDTDLPSGSERVWAAMRDREADVLVNIQGDEPLLPASVIDCTVELLINDERFGVTTASTNLSPPELENPDVVKVVVAPDGRALYFSRSAVPYPRGENPPGPLFQRHIGIYTYRRDVLEAFCSWERDQLEICESLEQLRFLSHGVVIGVARVETDAIGVDTEQDLERVRARYV